MFQTVRFIQMMSLTFGLFTQVSGSGPLGPLVLLTVFINDNFLFYSVYVGGNFLFFFCVCVFFFTVFVDENFLFRQFVDGNTLIHTVSQCLTVKMFCFTEFVSRLINSQKADGQTVLHILAHSDHTYKVLRLFVMQGKPNHLIRDDQVSPSPYLFG